MYLFTTPKKNNNNNNNNNQSPSSSPRAPNGRVSPKSPSSLRELDPLEGILQGLGLPSKTALWQNCRHSDLAIRHEYRSKVYVLVWQICMASLPADTLGLDKFQPHIDLLKPILTGGLGDGLEDSEEFHGKLLSMEDRSARFIFIWQPLIINVLNLLSEAYGLCMPLPDSLIEAIDPQHRPVSKLLPKLNAWAGNDAPFFGALPANLKQVSYLMTEEERALYQANFLAGRIVINGEQLDTSGAKGKQPGFHAFVISADGKVYIAPHEQGLFQHSSFFAMGPLRCLGMIKVVEGKIAQIFNHSGHYRPKMAAFQEALRVIPPSVYLKRSSQVAGYSKGAVISAEKPRLPGVIDYGMSSNFSFSRGVARATRSLTKHWTRHFTLPPLAIVHQIGARFELNPRAANLRELVVEFITPYVGDVAPDPVNLQQFLGTLPSIGDKLLALSSMPKYYGIACELFATSAAQKFESQHREAIRCLRDIYRDELSIAIAQIGENNPVTQFFDEKKRKNYHENSLSQINEIEIIALLTGSDEEKMNTLEEAAYVTLFYADFDATLKPFVPTKFEDMTFSALQLWEMKLLSRAYSILLGNDHQLQEKAVSSLLMRFTVQPSSAPNLSDSVQIVERNNM